MPTVLREGGYRFFFFSREGEEPPHIHVEQAERYAKFWLRPISLASSYGFRSHELATLNRLIGAGVGIHWPDVDEDISATSLLATH